MTRIVSYNILSGGYSLRENGARRTHQLTSIIRAARADVVGLVEAIHPRIRQRPLVIEEIASALNMQLIMSEIKGQHPTDYQLALMTRLPVISYTFHERPDQMRKPVLEVRLQDEDGQELTVFVIHLSAAFNKRWAGQYIRQREVEEILRITAPAREQQIPHVIMGDFNSLAPGDRLQGSNLIRYLVELDETRTDFSMSDGNPHLNFVVPPKLRWVKPLLEIIPRSPLFTLPFDTVTNLYAPRGCIRTVLQAGYTDCYRTIHPHAKGFTCPAAAPAGRIDFIFASPPLAQRLSTCYTLQDGEGVKGSQASDHLAVTAEFGVNVALQETQRQASPDRMVESLH